MIRRAGDLKRALAASYAGVDVCVGVVSRDEIVADASAPRPVFSITKPMVASLVQQELDLDDMLARWYPDFPRAGEITVRQLLQHTAGVPNYNHVSIEYVTGVARAPGDAWPIPVMLDHLAALPGHRGPSAFAYSNSGYWILGAILGADTVADALHARVFAPLGMDETRYPRRDDEARTDDGYSTLWAGPAGAAWSTPRDVLTFLARGVTDAAMHDTVPVVDADGPWDSATYGLGLMCDRRPDLGLVVGHGGSGPGCESMALYAPDAGVGACVIAPDTIRNDHAARILGVLA